MQAMIVSQIVGHLLNYSSLQSIMLVLETSRESLSVIIKYFRDKTGNWMDT